MGYMTSNYPFQPYDFFYIHIWINTFNFCNLKKVSDPYFFSSVVGGRSPLEIKVVDNPLKYKREEF